MATPSPIWLIPLLWIVVLVCWAPVLLSDRVRSLFERWPTGRLAVDYPLLVAAVVAAHAVLVIAVGVTFPAGSPWLPAWVIGSSLPVALLGWLTVVVVLPRTADIDVPDGVWLPLGIGAVWYVVVVGIVFLLIVVVLFALALPS